VHTKHVVTDALRHNTNLAKFIAALKTKGIDTVLRETDAGRIYGATFIDHHTGCVLNGSRFGKEFSANALQEHFTTPTDNVRLPNLTPTYEPTPLIEQALQQNDFPSGGLDLLSFDTQGTDSDEEAFIRLMKRKKKKKKQQPNI